MLFFFQANKIQVGCITLAPDEEWQRNLRIWKVGFEVFLHYSAGTVMNSSAS